MFGLEYLLALVSIAFKVGFAIVTAWPFRIAWNAVVPVYFAEYVPAQFFNIPYWHFVGILLVFSFLGDIIKSLTPKFVNVTQKNVTQKVEKE